MSEFKVNFPMGVFCSVHNTQFGESYKVTIDPAQFRGNPTDEKGRTSFWVSTSRNGKAYANLCSLSIFHLLLL